MRLQSEEKGKHAKDLALEIHSKFFNLSKMNKQNCLSCLFQLPSYLIVLLSTCHVKNTFSATKNDFSLSLF